jgi:hypothetical protein
MGQMQEVDYEIFGDDIMVYDAQGALVASARSLTIPVRAVRKARVAGFADV